MKKLISLLLAALLVCTLFPCTFADEQEPGWISAYRAVLDSAGVERKAQLLEDFGEDYANLLECSYLVYDIDKDGIPELVLKVGTCEADYTGTVYTCRDGQAIYVGDLNLGHCAIYSDPKENGIITYYGHMGYAFAERSILEGTELKSTGLLFEDDLNARLQSDPGAEYLDLALFVPGTAYLTLAPAALNLPLTRYTEITAALEGKFPKAAETYFPNHDDGIFERIIDGNGEVFAVPANPYANRPGRVPFRKLLEKEVAAPWVDGLEIRSYQFGDLNGDGKMEAVLALAATGSGSPLDIYLSEQDGTVYAYLENYGPDEISVDANGNLLCTTYYAPSLKRLIFDGEEAYLIMLPEQIG